MKWVSVFRGPIWQVSMVQARLHGLGFPTHVPDSTLKVLHPFITGGGTTLDAELQVPEDVATAVFAELENRAEPDFEKKHAGLSIDDGSAGAAGAAERGVDAADDDRVFGSEAARDLYRLGRRIRWATWCAVTVPIALVLAPDYFLRVRHLGQRPPAHGYVIVATVVAAVFMLWSVWSVGVMMSGG